MPAIDTQLIPIHELAAGEAATIRQSAIRTVVTLAASELKQIESKLVVRDVRPAADLDYTTEDWGEVTGGTINAYETMTTGTITSDRYWCIYGVKVAEPLSASLLRFTIGGGQRAVWNLQKLSFSDVGEAIGYTPFPIIVKPQVPYTIERYLRLIRNVSNIVLLSVIVEPRGLTISP